MTNTEETHLKLLDAYEQPEEFKRILKEALTAAEQCGAERERERIKEIIDSKRTGSFMGSKELDNMSKVNNATIDTILQALNPIE